MSMTDSLEQWLPTAQNTQLAGKFLAESLYVQPVDILLSGDLGAGKTTFLQGLAEGLGIAQPLTSPTYALEQRYQTRASGEFLHLDLYRLESRAADALAAGSDDHTGIRCIEWAERLTHRPEGPRILIELTEQGSGRLLRIHFEDAEIPPFTEVAAWREAVQCPSHIANHCHAVALCAMQLAASLLQQGRIIRCTALERAAELHDLLRFLDFRDGAAPKGMVDAPETQESWRKWKERYPGRSHEEACAAFLRERHLPVIARIVETHGLMLPPPVRTTIEQKILFYADKRVTEDRIVSLDERFADFAKRYANGTPTPEQKLWYEEAKETEHALFPDGPPF